MIEIVDQNHSPRTCRISEDTRVLGHIVCADPIICDAVIEGNVRGGQHVHIGPEAVVEGDVMGSSVSVEGLVKGRVQTRGHLVIGARARVTGDVRVRSLEVETGGRLDGRCTIEGQHVDRGEHNVGTRLRPCASRMLWTSEHTPAVSGTIGG